MLTDQRQATRLLHLRAYLTVTSTRPTSNRSRRAARRSPHHVNWKSSPRGDTNPEYRCLTREVSDICPRCPALETDIRSLLSDDCSVGKADSENRRNAKMGRSRGPAQLVRSLQTQRLTVHSPNRHRDNGQCYPSSCVPVTVAPLKGCQFFYISGQPWFDASGEFRTKWDPAQSIGPILEQGEHTCGWRCAAAHGSGLATGIPTRPFRPLRTERRLRV